jgi:hypothetical protein
VDECFLEVWVVERFIDAAGEVPATFRHAP